MKYNFIDRDGASVEVHAMVLPVGAMHTPTVQRNWDTGELIGDDEKWLYVTVNTKPFWADRHYYYPRNQAQRLLLQTFERWVGHNGRTYTKRQWAAIAEAEKATGRTMTFFQRKTFLSERGIDQGSHLIGRDYLFEPLPEGFEEQLEEVITNLNNDDWCPEWSKVLEFEPR